MAEYAILETGNGTSNLAKDIIVNGFKVYNLFEINATDSDPDGVGSQYANDVRWASNQVSNIKEAFDLFPNARLVFDIPIFK